MGLTRRWGLFKFGGSQGGSIGANGNQFSTRDRDTLDAVLAALESHTHEGGTLVADPSTGPTLTQAATGGTIPAGVDVYYRVAFLDAWGLETAASNEVYITTPAAIDAPAAPALTPTAGGTLPAGVYYYALTFFQNATGGETLASKISVTSLQGNNKSVTVDLPPLPAGADGWRVYRKGPNEADLFKLADVTAGTSSYLDDGSVQITGGSAPVENTTNGTNAVTVAVPDAATVGADPSAVKAWRIYRSYYSGQYGSASLVHEVVETVNQVPPYGGLVTSWVDTGASTLEGLPRETSAAFKPPAPVGTGGVQIAADAVTYDNTTSQLTATTVQAAVDELAGGGGGGGTASVSKVTYPVTYTTPAWASETDMPSVRQRMAVALVNGDIFALAGADSSGTALATVVSYDTTAKTWASKSDVPGGARTWPVAGAIGTDVLLAGGGDVNGNPLTRLDINDTTSDTWSAGPALPAAVRLAGGVVDGSLLYVIGGLDASSTAVTSVQVYDSVAASWSTKAALPAARFGVAVAVLNGLIYAVGGCSGASFFTDVYAYDPTSNSWTTKASLPAGRGHAAAVVVDGVLYLIGGYTTGTVAVADVVSYDPTSDTWSTTPALPALPAPRTDLGAVVLNNTIYVVGGGANGTAMTSTLSADPISTDNPIVTLAAPAQVGAITAGVTVRNATTGRSGDIVVGDTGDQLHAVGTAVNNQTLTAVDVIQVGG